MGAGWGLAVYGGLIENLSGNGSWKLLILFASETNRISMD